MKKGKAAALLSVVCVLMAFLLVMSFLKFSFGIYDYNSVIGAIGLDYDLAGGVSYDLTYDKENENSEVEDINEVIKTLSYRMDEMGYKSYKITAFKDSTKDVKDYSIRISMRNSVSADSDIAAVAAYGTVKFYGGEESDPTEEILSEQKAVNGAKYYGQSGDSYLTQLEFTDYAYKELKALLAENSDFYLKITLGDQTLLSSSLSSDSFSKMLYISTNGESSAKQVAMQIKTGGLDYRYNVEDQVSAEPLLGKNAALYCGLSLAVLLVLIIAAMLVMFGGYGVIAALSMLCFALLEAIMMVAVPGIYVSFAGIVGMGLATILTADGLIITVKRIREEYSGGKTVKAAVKTGFKRSFFPVLNVCVISAAVSLILFAFIGGTFRSFAVTFGIGMVIAFITDALIARMFTSLILPLCGNKEKFLNLKRED